MYPMAALWFEACHSSSRKRIARNCQQVLNDDAEKQNFQCTGKGQLQWPRIYVGFVSLDEWMAQEVLNFQSPTSRQSTGC